jgi:DNA-directed RNA polymerase subunit RPC12/RpoP
MNQSKANVAFTLGEKVVYVFIAALIVILYISPWMEIELFGLISVGFSQLDFLKIGNTMQAVSELMSGGLFGGLFGESSEMGKEMLSVVTFVTLIPLIVMVVVWGLLILSVFTSSFWKAIRLIAPIVTIVFAVLGIMIIAGMSSMLDRLLGLASDEASALAMVNVTAAPIVVILLAVLMIMIPSNKFNLRKITIVADIFLARMIDMKNEVDTLVREREREFQAEAEKRVFCNTCGATVIEGSVFCNRCGAKIEAPPLPDTLVCANCGVALVASDVFCANCGAKVATVDEDEPATDEAEGAMDEHQKDAPSSCPTCGTTYEYGDVFCGECGRRLEAANEE